MALSSAQLFLLVTLTLTVTLLSVSVQASAYKTCYQFSCGLEAKKLYNEEFGQRCAWLNTSAPVGSETIVLDQCGKGFGCDLAYLLDSIVSADEDWEFVQCTDAPFAKLNDYFVLNLQDTYLIDYPDQPNDWYDVCTYMTPMDCIGLHMFYGNSTEGAAKECNGPRAEHPECPVDQFTKKHSDCECGFDGKARCSLLGGDKPWCDFYTYACSQLTIGEDMTSDNFTLKDRVDDDAKLYYMVAKYYHQLVGGVPEQCFSKVFVGYPDELIPSVEKLHYLTQTAAADFLNVQIAALLVLLGVALVS